jgi:hypothetical protein
MVVVVTLTAMAASVWWISAIVPGQDYPQFLVFVRAVRDVRDPLSPFFGTYAVAPWYTPTSLPIHLTLWLSALCGGSIETAGRLLLTAQNVGLVAAGLYLLHVVGRPCLVIMLLFPIVHSAWTVVGGFAAFATAMPWVVLGWALTMRWLSTRDVRFGIAWGTTLAVTLLWHGIAFAELAIGAATLWSLWRAPSPRARLSSALPALPATLVCAVWLRSTFDGSVRRNPVDWRPVREALLQFVPSVWATVPGATWFAAVFALFVVLGFSRLPVGEPGTWRVRSPLLVVATVYLVAYFVLPLDLMHVEGLSNRFGYVAVLAAVFAWQPPAREGLRRAVFGAAGLLSVVSLGDMLRRFRAFDEETRGASALIDALAPRAALYAAPWHVGTSRAFAPGNKAMIELEQFATIRHGGLPNSSFAGYGFNYVRYVDGNPMPGLFGTPRRVPGVTAFDYVLVQARQGPLTRDFVPVARREGWELYGVCGTRRFPDCASESP